MSRFSMTNLRISIFSGQSKPADIPTDWVTMQKTCTTAMREQIQMEIKASMEYLSMGAYFSRDTVIIFYHNI